MRARPYLRSAVHPIRLKIELILPRAAPLQSSFTRSPRRTPFDDGFTCLWVSFPLRDFTHAQLRFFVSLPRPTSIRAQAFAASPRFLPRASLRAYSIPLPRPGFFAVQGLLSQRSHPSFIGRSLPPCRCCIAARRARADFRRLVLTATSDASRLRGFDPRRAAFPGFGYSPRPEAAPLFGFLLLQVHSLDLVPARAATFRSCCWRARSSFARASFRSTGRSLTSRRSSSLALRLARLSPRDAALAGSPCGGRARAHRPVLPSCTPLGHHARVPSWPAPRGACSKAYVVGRHPDAFASSEAIRATGSCSSCDAHDRSPPRRLRRARSCPRPCTLACASSRASTVTSRRSWLLGGRAHFRAHVRARIQVHLVLVAARFPAHSRAPVHVRCSRPCTLACACPRASTVTSRCS